MTAFSPGVLKNWYCGTSGRHAREKLVGGIEYQTKYQSNFRLGFEEIGHHFLVITCSIDGVNFKESTENTSRSLTL